MASNKNYNMEVDDPEGYARRHQCANNWEEVCELLDEIESQVEGPLARAAWVDFGKGGGWLLSNPAKSLRSVYLPGDYLVKMANSPRVMDTMERAPRVPEGVVKRAGDEMERGWSSEETRQLYNAAVIAVLKMEENARMRLLAKKIQWLEDNPYPPGRGRMYWPTWYSKLCKVAKGDVVCMDCLAVPKWQEGLKRPTWSVLHISDRERVAIKARTPPPTEHDQFFQCPKCANTPWLCSDNYVDGITPMWIVQDQDYYQPQLGGEMMEGKYMNSNWLAFVPKLIDPDKIRKGGRKRRDGKGCSDTNNNKENQSENN